jgi:hypothetical protein
MKSQKAAIEEISIPSGAIKREDLFNGFDTITEFQFLLVRLRVNHCFLVLTCFLDFNSFWCD